MGSKRDATLDDDLPPDCTAARLQLQGAEVSHRPVLSSLLGRSRLDRLKGKIHAQPVLT